MQIDTPNSRATDPESSHLAGEEITRSGARNRQQRYVVGLVMKTPGLTSRELSVEHGADYHMIARRLPECTGIKKGAARRSAHGNRLAVTWWPA